MADSEGNLIVGEGGESNERDGDQRSESLNVVDKDWFLPFNNVSRIMKRCSPANGKIAKDAKETVQEYASEFITFVTGEAAEKCNRENRKTINGDDLIWAMEELGFTDYIQPLRVYLGRLRDSSLKDGQLQVSSNRGFE